MQIHIMCGAAQTVAIRSMAGLTIDMLAGLVTVAAGEQLGPKQDEHCQLLSDMFVTRGGQNPLDQIGY